MPRVRRIRSDPKIGVDILYVAAGTTPGLRRADDAMLRALERCGVGTAAVTASFAPPAALRRRIYRSTLAIDLYESLALRWATEKALGRYSPRAIMYGATHAALFPPRDATPPAVAIRFDTPIQVSRPGRRFVLEHLVERSRFDSATVLLPTALEVDSAVQRSLPPAARVVPLPIPVQSVQAPDKREPITVAYAGSAVKKRLDVIVGAWSQASTGDRRLVVTGIAKDEALRFLARLGIAEPDNVEWAGLVSPAAFRELTRRAEIYLSAAAYENYGIAQLEALADGALLVTVPSAGPFAALPLARQLAPGLVASDCTAGALARSLNMAIELPHQARRQYRSRAGALVGGHSMAVLEDRLRSQVLPVLLNSRARGPAC